MPCSGESHFGEEISRRSATTHNQKLRVAEARQNSMPNLTHLEIESFAGEGTDVTTSGGRLFLC